MKKLLLLFMIAFLFMTVILLSGCEQGAIPAILNWFVKIESSETTGNTETEFVFTANSNDTILQWDIDGEVVCINERSATGTTLKYTFDAGEHKISVITENGAIDEITVIVEEEETEEETEAIVYTNTFKVQGVQRAATDIITLEGSVLIHNDTEYNIETMIAGVQGLPVIVTYTDTTRIINILLEVDVEDFFLFMNNNALNIHGIDLTNMTETEFQELLVLLDPPPESPPAYSLTVYNIQGVQRVNTQIIDIDIDGNIRINDEITEFPGVVEDDVLKVNIVLEVDAEDFFFFMEVTPGVTVLEHHFNWDFHEMTAQEVNDFDSIIKVFPAISLDDLKIIYGR